MINSYIYNEIIVLTGYYVHPFGRSSTTYIFLLYSQKKFALVGYVNAGGEEEMTNISQIIET